MGRRQRPNMDWSGRQTGGDRRAVHGPLLYQMIFAEKEIEEKAYKPILKQLSKKKILKHSRQQLEKNITMEEVTRVMENLPTGKQPGPNRIPNAVYKYLSKKLAPMLAAVLNHALVTGKLPDHFLEGDISVL
jgi:hypothetical protein